MIILFQVEMDVRIPHDVDPLKFDELKATEKAHSQELRRLGSWRQLWRVAGRYADVSIFDVESSDDQHALLISLALFPFMEMK